MSGLESLQELGGEGCKDFQSCFKYQWLKPTSPLWPTGHHISTSAASFPTTFSLKIRVLFHFSIRKASFLIQGFWRVCFLGLELQCQAFHSQLLLLVIQAPAQTLPAQRGPPWCLKETLPIPAIPLPLFDCFPSIYLSWSESALFLYSLTYCKCLPS